jgi:hypothetical protein
MLNRVSALPGDIFAFLSERQIDSLTRLRILLDEPEERFPELVRQAFTVWREVTDQARTPISSVIEVLRRVSMSEGSSRGPWGKQTEKNLYFLLQSVAGDYHGADEIGFESFLWFYVRYCSAGDVLGTVLDVTSGASEVEADGRTAPTLVRFVGWFFPSTDTVEATRTLLNGWRELWVVTHSEHPGLFRVLHKAQLETEVRAVLIYHDPIAQNPEQRFAVQFDPHNRRYAPTLRGILSDVLRLSEENTPRIAITPGPVRVFADRIAQRGVTEAGSGRPVRETRASQPEATVFSPPRFPQAERRSLVPSLGFSDLYD